MAAPWAGFSQDAWQSARAGDQAYRERYIPRVGQNDRLRAGPVQMGVGLSYSLEWNDNVRNSGAGAAAGGDLIQRPQLDLHAIWPATKDARLSLDTGLGYSYYTRNSQLDRLYISPNSELAWDIPVRDFVFTVYDRFFYSQDVISQAALSGVALFPRFDNTAGVRATWRPNRYLFQAGYGHQNYFSTSQQYNYVNRSSEQFFARAGYQCAKSTQAGIEVSASLTSYSTGVQSDNTSVSLGPFLEWQVTEAIKLDLRGGYVYYSFQGSPTAGPASDLSSYYAGMDARHQLTRNISHGLSASHSTEQGLNRGSLYNTVTRLNYNVAWAFYRHASMSGNVFYTRGSEPQRGLTQEYNQVGFGLAASYQLATKLSSRLSYQHTTRTSNQPGGNYQVNQVILGISYAF